MESSERRFAGKLSDVLLRRGLIHPDALQKAEADSLVSGVPLERYLAERDLVPALDMTRAVAEYLRMPALSLAHFTADPTIMEIVPLPALNRFQVIPLSQTGKMLTVAMADPFDIMAMDELRVLTGMDVVPVAVLPSEVLAILEKARTSGGQGIDIEDIMKSGDDDLQVGTQPAEELDGRSIEEMKESAEDGPVVRMVNTILVEAVRLRANDIHIEPQEERVRLRYRVDGVLIERPSLPKTLQNAIVSRVKIMSDLDIGEHRIPQDGRFRIRTLGKAVDVRVSILPTIFGGRVVMRTLDKSSLFPNLSALGLDKQAYESMSYAIAQPHGIVLVTGPTGSGKTTTLYSCLQELNKPDVNVVTCEEPVEYQIPGIIQVRINTEAGCTFAAALRAILRQDPDIILIGEIRDGESAEIAIKAALTGHLVLSTLHANDSASTITRLLDMDLEPFLLASSIILAQAQRLYRKLCPACRKIVEPSADLLKENDIDPSLFVGKTIYGPNGCPKCNNIGFKGRGAIMEVLAITDEVRSAIIRQDMADDIRDRAEKKGMITLRTAGLLKVLEGETSLEAALKITG